MTDTPAEPEDQDSLTPQQKLAALVARRKAASAPATPAWGDRRSAERNAAARSASRSKPAMRK